MKQLQKATIQIEIGKIRHTIKFHFLKRKFEFHYDFLTKVNFIEADFFLVSFVNIEEKHKMSFRHWFSQLFQCKHFDQKHKF